MISAEMFKGSDHIASEWLLPLLKAEDILEHRFSNAKNYFFGY
ncbi:MAG: hypothetical protein QNJ18_16180 [Xenococcaceae cyanobacterium MO_167.B52]|nr:hypothetical protein [Xenococcaceae cyanobacterium MO_167.B52]